jgi:peptidoglycan/LPS O-acetylase OafA/YrhL
MSALREPVRLNSVDALRAFAVIPVILFHLNPALLPGGYLGVDVFFVISGYLITGILLNGINAGTFGFWDFYARRIRRILPALLVMLVTVAAIWLWYEPWAFAQLAQLARSAISLRANFAIKNLVGDYWGGDAQAQPLLHTWSLAVEEQFYLIFPFVIWSLWRFCSRRLALGALVILAVGSFVWYIRCSEVLPTVAFYDATARAWELLAGALLAAYIYVRPRTERDGLCSDDWIGWAGILAVIVAYASPALGVAHEWRPVLAVLGTAAFLWAAPQRRGVHAIVDRPALVYVGLISYSLYLWHWPVVVLARGMSGWGLSVALATVLEVLLIITLGVASFHLVEKPLRRGRSTTWVILGACVVAYFGIRQVAREHEKAFGDVILAVGRVSAGGDSYETVGGFRRMTVGGTRFSESTHMSAEVRRKYRHLIFESPQVRPAGTLLAGGNNHDSGRVLVWGDSHAMVMAPTIDRITRELGIKAEFRIKDGEDPFLILPPAGDDLAKAGHRALQARPDCCIFVFRYDTRRFADYEATFAEILRYTKLIVVQQPPVLAMPDVCSVDYFAYLRDQKRIDLGTYVVGEQGRSIEGRQHFERQLIARFGSTSGFTFLQLDSILRDSEGRPKWWDGRSTLFYIDDDHLSEFGAQKVESLIRSKLKPSVIMPK